MTKKELDFCLKTYKRMMEGTYDPFDLQTAYELITGQKELVNVRVKRLAVYNYFQNIYKPEQSIDKTQLAVEPPVVLDSTPSELHDKGDNFEWDDSDLKTKTKIDKRSKEYKTQLKLNSERIDKSK